MSARRALALLNSPQVDIEIYQDKLGQSGDRILSSHIKNTIGHRLLH